MNKLTKKERFQESVLSRFHVYNSIFATLPYDSISDTGNLLPIFTEHCKLGYSKKLDPKKIVQDFFSKYCEGYSKDEEISLIFRFIQYIERQVVLFDAIEDASFTQVNNMGGVGTLRNLKELVESSNKKKELKKYLRSFKIKPVLTAHPTQFYPGSVLGIITDLANSIEKNDLTEIKNLLSQLGKTPFFKQKKPTPYDEAVSLSWYLENVFYYSVSNIFKYVKSNIFDNSYGGENPEINNYIEETVSFKQSSKEFLIEQVNIAFKNELDRQIAFLLIDNLEGSGFLKISLKDFSIDIGIDENKVNKVLSELKKFEPIGVFSQSLEESFLLQLEDRKLLNNSIKNLINNLEILASGDLKKLIKICDTDESGIFKMLKIIRSCNPKPLSSFDENDYDDIKEPDVIVKKVKSKWIVELNENTLPKVLVNSGYYEELASKNLTKEDKDYLATRYASGKWLLKALEQRSATILRVSREIIRQQNSFLEAGLAYIKPMILKDIAKELDLHESTISRITNSKEIDTPRGIYSLKFFFSKAIASNGNEDISSQSVKTKIRNFIDNETVKTLSDTKLRDLVKTLFHQRLTFQ